MMGYDGRALHLCGIFLPNLQPQSNHEKASEKFRLRDIPQNAWPVYTESVKVMREDRKTVTEVD